MGRRGIIAAVMAVAIVAAWAGNAAAEDLTPNGSRVDAQYGGGVFTNRYANEFAGEMFPDVMRSSVSIQREFRRALPSIYSYSQTAHYQNRADVGSESALASSTVANADYTLASCPTTMCSPGSKWVMWDVPWMMTETQKRKDNYLGYRSSTQGFATGVSRMLGEASAIGFAVGYDARKLDGRNGYHMRNRADTLHLALYGGTNIGNVFIDGYVGWSRSWNRSERNVDSTVPNNMSVVKANYKDDVLSAGLKASYVWILGNDARITPSIGVDFSRVTMKAFNERTLDFDDDALRFNRSSYTNVAVPIMVTANKTFSSCWLRFRDANSLWTPEIRAGWVPQFGSKNAVGNAYAIEDGVAFRTKSAPAARSYGTVGTGLKIKLADRYIFALEYDYTFASKYSNHSLTAMYGVSF